MGWKKVDDTGFGAANGRNGMRLQSSRGKKRSFILIM
jgi:hypothetical protein